MRKSLTEGAIFKTLFLYSLPILITNVVQLFFHIADVAVLSLMADDAAVAAVAIAIYLFVYLKEIKPMKAEFAE